MPRSALPVPTRPLAIAPNDPPAPLEGARLEVPEGATVELMRCALCEAPMGAVVIPPSPPLPFELRTMLRPVVRYIARKTPALQAATEMLLEGKIGAMISALRQAEQIAAVVPVVCARCLVTPRVQLPRGHGHDQ